MRRRDADGSSPFLQTQDTRWPVLVAAALSLVLHGALVAAIGIAPLVRPNTSAVIQVSLLPGSGGPERAGAAGDGGVVDHNASLRQAPALSPKALPWADGWPPFQGSDQTNSSAGEKQPHRGDHSLARGNAPAERRFPRGSTLPDAGGPGGNGDGADVTGAGSRHGADPGAADGFDPRAACAYCPEPSYPLLARSRGWQGTVEVALSVLADGSVAHAGLRRSSGYPALDEAAIAVARQSRFRPPRDGGVPAPLRGRIEYRFVLR